MSDQSQFLITTCGSLKKKMLISIVIYWLICKMCYWALRFIYLKFAKISEIWCEPSNPSQWKHRLHLTPKRFFQTGEGNKFVLQSDLGPANFWDQWKNQVPKSRALNKYHPEFILFSTSSEMNSNVLICWTNFMSYLYIVLQIFHIQMKLSISICYNQKLCLSGCHKQLLWYVYRLKPWDKSLYRTNYLQSKLVF